MAGRPLKPLPRPTTPAARLGAELRRRRLAAGLSTQAAAEVAAIAPGTWNDWERGAYAPSVDRVPAIADAVGCTVADLLATMTGAKPAPPRSKPRSRRMK